MRYLERNCKLKWAGEEKEQHFADPSVPINKINPKNKKIAIKIAAVGSSFCSYHGGGWADLVRSCWRVGGGRLGDLVQCFQDLPTGGEPRLVFYECAYVRWRHRTIPFFTAPSVQTSKEI